MCEWECDAAPVFMGQARGQVQVVFNHGSSRWLTSLYRGHHSYYTPVSHRCLLSINVNSPRLTKQFLSTHFAAEIQSHGLLHCAVILLLSSTIMLPVRQMIAVLTLRKGEGCSAEGGRVDCQTGTVCRSQCYYEHSLGAAEQWRRLAAERLVGLLKGFTFTSTCI